MKGNRRILQGRGERESTQCGSETVHKNQKKNAYYLFITEQIMFTFSVYTFFFFATLFQKCIKFQSSAEFLVTFDETAGEKMVLQNCSMRL